MAWKRVAALVITCQALHYAPPQHAVRRHRIRMQATATAARPAKLDTLVQAMAGLPDDKYRYKQLLHWAQEAPSLPSSDQIDSNKVPGCLSTVYVVASLDEDGTVLLQGDSDAQLTKGLVVLLVKGLSGALPEEILSVDASFIKECGVAASLTPGRNNGFVNMLGVVKSKVAALSGGSVSGTIDVDALSAKLAALQPTAVEASGPGLRVVAACFEGLAPEKRQALVNAVLGPEGEGVEVVCETPGEAG
jgi:cysteine desulfuration protein SufE